MVTVPAKLVSNKYCSVKMMRTISVSANITIDGEAIGKGSTFNINNITTEQYKILCNALGINGIKPEMPLFLELRLADGTAEKGEWKDTHMPEEEEEE